MAEPEPEQDKTQRLKAPKRDSNCGKITGEGNSVMSQTVEQTGWPICFRRKQFLEQVQ